MMVLKEQGLRVKRLKKEKGRIRTLERRIVMLKNKKEKVERWLREETERLMRKEGGR